MKAIERSALTEALAECEQLRRELKSPGINVQRLFDEKNNELALANEQSASLRAQLTRLESANAVLREGLAKVMRAVHMAETMSDSQQYRTAAECESVARETLAQAGQGED